MKTENQKLIFIGLVLLAFMLAGCSGMQPKQKAAAIMNSYNKAYDDYQMRVDDPNLTPEQKDILKTQKQILTELYPKIKIYNKYVETGQIPTREIEAEINELLFKLEKLVLAPPD